MNHQHPHATVTVYTCSMHPEVVQEPPGNCPKCGMQLIAQGEDGAGDMPSSLPDETQRHESGGHSGHDMTRMNMHEGKSFWRTFWIGGTLDQENTDQRTPRYGAPVSELFPATAWGVTMPWTLLASAGLGIWLMFGPEMFDTTGSAANSSHIVGALVITVAVTVMAEVVRSGRFLNIIFGAWVIAAPWLLTGGGSGAKWNGALIGLLLILLSLPRGAIRERYGTWDRLIV